MSHKLSTARTSQKGVKTAARLHVASKPKSASQRSGFVAPKLAQAKASSSAAKRTPFKLVPKGVSVHIWWSSCRTCMPNIPSWRLSFVII